MTQLDAAGLGLTTIDPWGDPGKGFIDAQDRALDANATALAISGPSSVPLDARDTLPVIGLRAYDPAAAYPIDFSREALVTVSRIDARQVLADTVFMLRDPPPPPLLERPRSGLSAMPFQLELRDRLQGLPWQAGTLVVTVHVRDQASNRLRVRLSPGAVVEHDAAVQEYIERQRRLRAAAGPPAPVWPTPTAGAPVRYTPLPGSPPVAEAAGITLAAERVVVLGRDRCVLHGRWRLPARPSDVVRPLRRQGARPDEPGVLPDVGDAEAKSVIPISLVVAAHGSSPGPTVIDLRVPSYDVVPAATDEVPEPLVTGVFAIDLFGLKDMPRLPLGYTIWALSGEHLSAPCNVSIITPDMLQA